MPNSLVICTVGGTPEPVVASLKHWRPDRVVFVPTRETASQIKQSIIPLASAEGFELDVGRYDLFLLTDGQDFALCVERLRELTSRVHDWLQRGDDFRVIVDFTGGTKCMSAAIAMQSARWKCVYSYVGGAERTKGGVGIVVSGREQVINSQNPWDALGYQAAEDALTLFDQHAYGSAARLLEHTLKNTASPARKRELTALRTLFDAYDAWDRFRHRDARQKLDDLAKYENDLRFIFSASQFDAIRETLRVHARELDALLAPPPPFAPRIRDLLGNARRRAAAGRWDDAVARLYRIIEAIAQAALAERHGIHSTKRIPLDSIPPGLRPALLASAQDGEVTIGLQDAFAFLHALGDPAGAAFHALGLADNEKSPLSARNSSILAHGWEPVGEKVFQQLWQAALTLADVDENSLTIFPRLSILSA